MIIIILINNIIRIIVSIIHLLLTQFYWLCELATGVDGRKSAARFVILESVGQCAEVHRIEQCVK